MQNNRLLTFVGTGGVGKTSLSLSVAIEAARMGKRVAAITVDPSKRLSSLILDENGKKREYLETLPGELDIYSVDAQKVFHQFVSDHIGEKLYSVVKKNKIYNQIAHNLRETHNFSALYQMVQVIDQEQYDLVILDTPPCHQVLDFFQAPQRLKKFFTSQKSQASSGLTSWVQEKGLFAAEKLLSGVVGKEFVDEIQAFFKAVSDLKFDITEVSDRFTQILGHEKSTLLLVFSGAKDKTAEARYLQREIGKINFCVDHFVLNRGYPLNLDLSKELVGATDSLEEELYNYFADQETKSLQILNEMKQAHGNPELKYVLLPDLSTHMKTEEDVFLFSKQIHQNWRVL